MLLFQWQSAWVGGRESPTASKWGILDIYFMMAARLQSPVKPVGWYRVDTNSSPYDYSREANPVCQGPD
jgi:hypothetical protein